MQDEKATTANLFNDLKIYMSIIKDSWMYQIAIFLTFSVCLSVFPAVTQLIQPIQKGECNYEEHIYQIAANATMQKNAFIRFFNFRRDQV